MGWKETRVQDERLQLCLEFEAGEQSRAEICRCYRVSRKTGYKWWEQYQREGVAGLIDRSRAPHEQPHAGLALRVVDRRRAQALRPD